MKARYYCISCSKLVEEEFGDFIVTLNKTGPSYAGGGDPEEQDFVCWDCLDREAAEEVYDYDGYHSPDPIEEGMPYEKLPD